jgi:outer membrane biosynthesis protein TonB
MTRALATLIVSSMLATGLLSGCASEPKGHAATAPLGVSHTCTAAQQPMVDRFAKQIDANLHRAMDEAVRPVEAKTSHMHGRVGIVVGYTQGERQQVGIARSSGYAALDNHAVDLVTRAMPEHAGDLPCDAVTVRVAIFYGDDRQGWPIHNATSARGAFATPMW